MPRFVIHHVGEDSRVFELIGDRPTSIGRAKSSNIVLDDLSVSRLHAVVLATPDNHWQIVDRSKSNAISVNGKPTKDAVLRAHDEITIGGYRMYFEDSEKDNIVSYGTIDLPRGLTQIVNETAYSTSFLPAEPLEGGAIPMTNDRYGLPARLRTLEKENRLLSLLYRVNCALAELQTVKNLTDRVLDLVLEIEGAERGYTMLLEEDSAERSELSKSVFHFQPAIIRYRGAPVKAQDRSAPQFTISQSIIRQVMQNGLPVLLSDGQADPRFSSSQSVMHSGIQSAMCAPLGIANRFRGLLYVDNLSRRGMFTVDHLNIFGVIALQAGLAIDRIHGQVGIVEKAPA